MSNVRLQAARVLTNILQNQGSLSVLQTRATGNDNALLQELCYGVCRHYHELSPVLASLLKSPLKKKDLDIQCLLLLGLYQLFYLRIPDHAAINETVSAVRKPWARGLVNAVLRESLRRYPDYSPDNAASPGQRYSHPDWLVSRLQQDWPDHFEMILAGNNARAPMTLRVNARQTSRDEYLDLLSGHNIAARPGGLAPMSVIPDQPVPVNSLPGFTQGLVSVQDEASQLAATLLRPEAGMRVLDACAAPGGKTCALLELEPDLQLLALDNDAERLARVQSNLERLNLNAELQCADAGALDSWYQGEAFDRILLDAPCSATGVIRRHPDIKLLRTESQVRDLTSRQADLLSALWAALKPGGIMLYSTCSTLIEENSLQIANFIGRFPDARALPLVVDWGLACQYGRQLLPGQANCDGFYYALLEKC
ncbi:MAG: 16S rRNA (cytosine(967)-C(5))-methyltransferase RsmB [Pseudohongiellaceae bacterium]